MLPGFYFSQPALAVTAQSLLEDLLLLSPNLGFFKQIQLSLLAQSARPANISSSSSFPSRMHSAFQSGGSNKRIMGKDFWPPVSAEGVGVTITFILI